MNHLSGNRHFFVNWQKQAGLSLIELMIALLIGTILLGGVM